MQHGPAIKLSDDKASKKKASLGVKLFFIYLLIYAGFVLIGLISPELMGKRIAFGLNLAIVYGFGLIILAVIMGWIYHMVCSSYEDKMNKEE